jgi:hypothetical protein
VQQLLRGRTLQQVRACNYHPTVLQNNAAQALAADAAFCFDRVPKGDCVRLVATNDPDSCAAAREASAADDAAAVDCSSSDDAASVSADVDASSLRILQMMQVVHPA